MAGTDPWSVCITSFPACTRTLSGSLNHWPVHTALTNKRPAYRLPAPPCHMPITVQLSQHGQIPADTLLVLRNKKRAMQSHTNLNGMDQSPPNTLPVTHQGSANHRPVEKARISHNSAYRSVSFEWISHCNCCPNWIRAVSQPWTKPIWIGLQPQHSAQDYHSWMSNFLTLQVCMKSEIFTNSKAILFHSLTSNHSLIFTNNILWILLELAFSFIALGLPFTSSFPVF